MKNYHRNIINWIFGRTIVYTPRSIFMGYISQYHNISLYNTDDNYFVGLSCQDTIFWTASDELLEQLERLECKVYLKGTTPRIFMKPQAAVQLKLSGILNVSN